MPSKVITLREINYGGRYTVAVLTERQRSTSRSFMELPQWATSEKVWDWREK